ncbi:MAG: deoxyribose-phosphate aldolase [Defluviitaleaceae bacterium]|nr:deoxyribose-phosphate aldolase [Defluviitaleaceae bacterium]
MSDKQILACVDHTLLKPFATWEDIVALCDEAVAYNVASVCVPPTYVWRIGKKYGTSLVICTVVGFPLGYSSSSSKFAEVQQALSDGATEIDMVINISDAKNGEFGEITDEISTLKRVCGSNVLKVIIETCYLTEVEKISLCKCVTDAGADFIKTSTGFGTNGATMADVLLFREHIGSGVKIKAAGGVRTREDMVAFIEAGCARIGTSSAVKILGGEKPAGY